MKEKNMWAKLRDRLKLHRARCSRIENMVETGTPDINLCVGGRELWIETKLAQPAARNSSLLLGRSHQMTNEQVNWHLRQHLAGGKSFIWVQLLARAGEVARHFLIPGRLAAQVNSLTIASAGVYEYTMDGIVDVLLSC